MTRTLRVNSRMFLFKKYLLRVNASNRMNCRLILLFSIHGCCLILCVKSFSFEIRDEYEHNTLIANYPIHHLQGAVINIFLLFIYLFLCTRLLHTHRRVPLKCLMKFGARIRIMAMM